jgi:hypothetical protein
MFNRGVFLSEIRWCSWWQIICIWCGSITCASRQSPFACSGDIPRESRAIRVLVIVVCCYLLKPHTLRRHTFNIFICVSSSRRTWCDTIKWDLMRRRTGEFTESSWLRIETMGQFFLNCNKPSVSTKCKIIIAWKNCRISIHRPQTCSFCFNPMLYLILNNSSFINYESRSK